MVDSVVVLFVAIMCTSPLELVKFPAFWKAKSHQETHEAAKTKKEDD